MVHVSKKYLEENLKREIWGRFLREISNVKSADRLENSLEKFFTPSERVMLEKRLAIMYLIEHGLRYRDISKIIDVSSSTISFIRGGFKKKKGAKKEKALSPVELKISPPKFKKRRFPAYKGRGRWGFITNPL
jgi:Trp operon repressor